MAEKSPYKMDGFDVVAVFVMVPINLLFRTWATSVLWHWFAVPAGFPPVRYGILMGLVIVYGYITFDGSKRSPDYSDSAEFYGRLVGTPLIGGILFLVVGFIVRGFML